MLRKKIGMLTAAGAGAVLLVAGCGGSGGGDGMSTPASTTTDVPVTVIDGAIQNATVCLDRNTNGACDTGEPTGTTDAAGKVTLKVDNADVGKYPVLAIVGTNAIDADTGAVATAYTLSAPADRSAVVSPLTTLVHTAIASSGLSSTEAEAVVRSQTGLEISLFTDYTRSTDSNATAAASLAQLVVLVTQEQNTTLAGKVGSNDAEGKPITSVALQTAVRKAVLESIDTLSIAATQTEVLAAPSPRARAGLLAPKVSSLATGTGLTPATLATVVAVNNQLANPVATTRTPTRGFSLHNLEFTNASNYYQRFFTSTVAQDTVDANGDVHSTERRFRATGGVVAAWSTGGNPARNADLNWNGSAWVSCPINFEQPSKPRDADGRSSYSYCEGRETGRSQAAFIDIAGKAMREVYQQIRDGGYTNYFIADPSVLGTATFPAGSTLRYTSGTVTSAAPSYYPGRSAAFNTGNNANNGNTVFMGSVAAGAGGDARVAGSTPACAATVVTTELKTLEEMVARAQGSPCIFGQDTTGSAPFVSDSPSTGWGNTSVSLGTIGNAPYGFGVATGYYTTNTRLRVAFKGSGANATTYYACKERFRDGSSRQCTEIGTGTYSIETLGDARVMRFQNLPAQASALTYTRVFVERGGAIYYGYQNRLSTFSSARLGTIGGTALLNQLGLPVPDPEQPLALTAASYQGTWDIWDPVSTPTRIGGLSLLVATDGTASCGDIGSSAPFQSCTLNITNPATGAFTLSAGTATLSGTLDFQAAMASGTYSDPGETPPSGSFVGWRR